MDIRVRFFNYVVDPVASDKGNASTVSFSKSPDCTKISGLLAGRACRAFLDSSLELEGIRLEVEFAEDFKNFKGEGVFLQHGGSGVSESRTTINIQFLGSTVDL